MRARQRVDAPKRLQSRRAHQRQPPCPGAQSKTPRRAKSGRAGFSFDFSTHQRKDADVDGFNASQRFALFFFRRTAASGANHLFDSQMMQKNARKSARLQALPAPTLFFQGLSPPHGPKPPARLRAPSQKNAPYTTIARLFFCACDDKPTQARQRPKAC